MMTKRRESPSAEERRKFSTICGVNTTTQQAMEMEPRMPERASMSIGVAPFEELDVWCRRAVAGYMVVVVVCCLSEGRGWDGIPHGEIQ